MTGPLITSGDEKDNWPFSSFQSEKYILRQMRDTVNLKPVLCSK